MYVVAGGLGALVTSPLGLQAARPALLALAAGVFAAEHLARVHLHAWLNDHTQVRARRHGRRPAGRRYFACRG